MCLKTECYLVEMGYWIDKSKKIFKRNEIIPYKLSNYIVSQRNNTGVFSTAYRYDKENANESYLFGDMYFDFDSKDDFEAVREDAISTVKYLKTVYNIENNEVKIYFSGNKGLHIIIPNEVLDIEPLKNLNQVYKYMARGAREYSKNKTLDLVIYDNKRLFRIPHTIHESTNLYKIPIKYEELTSLSHNSIKDLAKNKRNIRFKKPSVNNDAKNMYLNSIEKFKEEIKSKKKAKKNTQPTLTYSPPCIDYILINGASSGNRNNTAAALTSFYKNCKIDVDTAESLVLEWNNSRNNPPLDDDEISKTVSSIYGSRVFYGCSSLECLSECSKDKCRLKRGKRNEIQEEPYPYI